MEKIRLVCLELGVGIQVLTVAVVVEEGLQDQCGGDLVDDLLVILAGTTSFVENLVRLATGEALVPQMDGEPCEFAEFRCELPGLESARAVVSG